MFVGVDIGTQSLKAVVLDRNLAVGGEAAVGYRPSFPQPGWAEQEPSLWLNALHPAIEGALTAAGITAREVLALGVAGQLDGCIPTAADGTALGSCLIWLDRRASAELDRIPGDVVRQRGGVVLDPSHMAAKIRWLKHHHPASRRIACFHQPVSFVVAHLTGRAVFDHGLASTTMLYDLVARRLDADLLDRFGIAVTELPELAEADSVAGPLTAAGAALTGLVAGTPVAVGTGDDFANPLGAGVVEPGTVACTLGTAEVVGAPHGHPVIDHDGLVETHGYAGGHYFIENPGWLSGGTLSWFIDTWRLTNVAELDRLAAGAPPGSDGLIFLPALGGAMAPEWVPGARGCFYGLTAAHEAGHLARATLEGCAYAMCDVIDRLTALGVDTGRLVLLGGGARSALWAQIRADVMARPVNIPATTDGSPVGAALLAATACGAEPSLAAAAARIGRLVARSVLPSEKAIDACRAGYRRYRKLFEALRPMYSDQKTTDGP